ncbi:hypothetical protein NESM_000746800 [Novymonas esmeraldas]|uniref:Uncharacterized protein n=1 Tax=Novymonas esmeraldas TaxID=1808958 RepID=A0AAW0EUV3_9TRYP
MPGSDSSGASARWLALPSGSDVARSLADQDPNVGVLRASERIQKLTRAVDVLVARDFLVHEDAAILDDLEVYLASLESEVKKAETQSEELRGKCALLRPGQRRSVAGESAEVSALWCEYGESMTRLVLRHSARLVELESALAAAAAAAAETTERKSPTPGPLPPPPVLRPSTAASTAGAAAAAAAVDVPGTRTPPSKAPQTAA